MKLRERFYLLAGFLLLIAPLLEAPEKSKFRGPAKGETYETVLSDSLFTIEAYAKPEDLGIPDIETSYDYGGILNGNTLVIYRVRRNNIYFKAGLEKSSREEKETYYVPLTKEVEKWSTTVRLKEGIIKVEIGEHLKAEVTIIKTILY